MKKEKGGLGRGLSELLLRDDGNEFEKPQQDGQDARATLLEITDIVPCADQPRKHFDEDALQN